MVAEAPYLPIFCYFGWLVWAPNTQFWGLYRHSKNTPRRRVLREARYTPKHPETTLTLAVVVRLVEIGPPVSSTQSITRGPTTSPGVGRDPRTG